MQPGHLLAELIANCVFELAGIEERELFHQTIKHILFAINCVYVPIADKLMEGTTFKRKSYAKNNRMW